ncbi:tryptophan 2,3-dioxygenase [Nonomuraea angiospora]|uniref:tryptophan 2,3-dioxygenase n=3 Tax=Nonomuraea angiospora TaxID=46172 RepID=UPI00367930CD
MAATNDTRAPVLTEGARTGAVPTTGTEFSRYVASTALLSLQDFRTAAPAEPSFLIITQVMELLFKLSYIEACQARDQIQAGSVDDALAALRRLRETQQVAVQGWGVLSALSPVEYLRFRDDLGNGTGFQSYAFRQWEFVLGKKDAALIRPYAGDPVAEPALKTALAEPSVYDAVLGQFARYDIHLPSGCLRRDRTGPYEPHAEVELAWRRVYGDPRRYEVLYRLAEALMDVAYEFARWQSTHILVVERVLGAKRGTGGTTGVAWLRKASERRVFPELWSLRAGL